MSDYTLIHSKQINTNNISSNQTVVDSIDLECGIYKIEITITINDSNGGRIWIGEDKYWYDAEEIIYLPGEYYGKKPDIIKKEFIHQGNGTLYLCGDFGAWDGTISWKIYKLTKVKICKSFTFHVPKLCYWKYDQYGRATYVEKYKTYDLCNIEPGIYYVHYYMYTGSELKAKYKFVLGNNIVHSGIISVYNSGWRKPFKIEVEDPTDLKIQIEGVDNINIDFKLIVVEKQVGYNPSINIQNINAPTTAYVDENIDISFDIISSVNPCGCIKLNNKHMHIICSNKNKFTYKTRIKFNKPGFYKLFACAGYYDNILKKYKWIKELPIYIDVKEKQKQKREKKSECNATSNIIINKCCILDGKYTYVPESKIKCIKPGKYKMNYNEWITVYIDINVTGSNESKVDIIINGKNYTAGWINAIRYYKLLPVKIDNNKNIVVKIYRCKDGKITLFKEFKWDITINKKEIISPGKEKIPEIPEKSPIIDISNTYILTPNNKKLYTSDKIIKTFTNLPNGSYTINAHIIGPGKVKIEYNDKVIYDKVLDTNNTNIEKTINIYNSGKLIITTYYKKNNKWEKYDFCGWLVQTEKSTVFNEIDNCNENTTTNVPKLVIDDYYILYNGIKYKNPGEIECPLASQITIYAKCKNIGKPGYGRIDILVNNKDISENEPMIYIDTNKYIQTIKKVNIIEPTIIYICSTVCNSTELVESDRVGPYTIKVKINIDAIKNIIEFFKRIF